MRGNPGWVAATLGWAVIMGCSTSAGGGDAGTGDAGTGATSSAQCTLKNFTSATTQECFDCMKSSCCAETQACDSDPDCVYCAANPTDATARCVDPTTFAVRESQRAMNRCQTDKCTPPCGIPGGGGCTPGNCPATCANFSSGCR